VKLGWIEEDLKKSVRAAELLVRPPEAIRRLKDFDFCVLYVAKKDAQRVTMSASWLRTIIAMDFSPPFDPAVPAAPKPADPAPPQSAQRVESCIGRFFGWLLGRHEACPAETDWQLDVFRDACIASRWCGPAPASSRRRSD
jgi:hypothetical protein